MVRYLCVSDQDDRGLSRFHHSRHVAMAYSSAPATLELGDRFEVFPVDSTERLKLPRVLGPDGFPIERIEDPTGRLVEVELDPVRHSALVPGLVRGITNPVSAFWLEYQGSGTFRLIVEPVAVPLGNGEQTTEQGVRIEFDSHDRSVVLSESSFSAGLRDFELALEAARLATHAGFDRLIALPLVRDIELLEHQIRTAKTVLRRFRGRAMLCDEVGLGKTIEAGLVLSELMIRGLVRSVLVLVPPSLIEQWQGEMRRKFSIELISHDSPSFRERGTRAWTEFDRVIASIHTAKREPHRSAILARKWDMVIVDEAHHLRNRNTQAWKFASEVQKQFILLLTATPVQNNLEELFNLVTLLEPGLLSTARRFHSHFVDRRDKLTPRNVDELHGLLAEVMVRNRRSTVGLQFTRRWAKTERIALSPPEQSLYQDVTEFVRGHLRASKETASLTRMALVTLQMAMGSSSQAAAGTLGKIAEHPKLATAERQRLLDLADRASAQRENTKVDRLLDLVGEYRDKMVIFTQFRATQEMLRVRLAGAGHDVAVFHGGLVAAGEGGGHRAVPRPGAAPALHRGRQRGTQSPVRPCRLQLRPALEPDEDRAADRPAQPDRPDPRRPRLQPGRRRHGRGGRAPPARGQAQHVRAGHRRGRHDPRQPRGRTRVPGRRGRPLGRIGRHRRLHAPHRRPGRPTAGSQARLLRTARHDDQLFGNRFAPDQ